MKPKRNDYFLCPIPWTEINIFKRSDTFFPSFLNPELCLGNAGVKAGIGTSAETPSLTVLSVTAAILI